MIARHRRTAPALVAFSLICLASLAFGTATAAATTYSYGQHVTYPLVFPVEGETHYSDSFGAPRAGHTHQGQDLMSSKMTPVLAAASGRVEYLGSSCCSLTLRHDDGWQSRAYLHLNNDTEGTDDGAGWGIADGIAAGVHVEAGQVIGWVGDSGNAEGTSPHLHFELRAPNGSGLVTVNPYDALLAAQGKETSVRCTAASTTPLAALLAATTPLRNGSRGAAVYELQAFLRLRGFAVGVIDGKFGDKTEAAVRAFQTNQGLAVDGVAGTATRAKIKAITQQAGFASMANPGARVLRPGATGPDVKELQRWLKAAGYQPGVFDGKYGAKTTAAVKAFQKATSGLVVDGKVGATTRRALATALKLKWPGNC